MPRVKRGTIHAKVRRNLKAQAKGFMWGRKSKMKLMRIAILKSGKNAYRDRRLKKRDMRALWQLRINAAARENGWSYSKLMGGLKKAGVIIDRKVLSMLAAQYPAAFKSVCEMAKK